MNGLGDPGWGKLYESIGAIVVTMNTAHWLVFEMMSLLLNTSREDTVPIYYSLKADAAQRDLTLAIAADRLTHPIEAGLLSRISAAVNDLGKLSGVRNAFIHTHWMQQSSSSGVRFACEGKPHPKLDLNDPLGQAKKLLTSLDELIDRLGDLCDELEAAPSVQALQQRTGGRHR